MGLFILLIQGRCSNYNRRLYSVYQGRYDEGIAEVGSLLQLCSILETVPQTMVESSPDGHAAVTSRSIQCFAIETHRWEGKGRVTIVACFGIYSFSVLIVIVSSKRLGVR
jgi:hypothetical protein